ncbi:putative pyridine nucleotide-disulfide oxidoreductase [Actinoplanes missouriensis 431]|uniref:NADH:ubiquinone reductase (non-electrogenic) n=1 Tax=Actinoplanes missouriensis (strain ATCC 14538 / DSM 43046 / CBS 188.64 / JCM 3121 / NBRC 102363 / NCIMB 12654 / NRRL B-3342 / UNCC 431) TaxID=512565 RepID=I0H5N8_ACTM4|nr:NAD(P)/FAD-dependent oxidoreductase [Actinoplanes missouriensis]BAL88325.1 putative pyridine nucleotide-disulfide oxidoreductase [Actinoplanes missouriensis 431]
MGDRHKVVVVGAGFGGLSAAKALHRADVDVTLINGTTHHLFQPLLYQVATGILSEGEIAVPVREILKKQDNAEVLIGHVADVDVDGRTVTATAPNGTEYQVGYDTLIVAAGASQSYFGNDHFAQYAPGMKTVDDALELRGRIFGAFEMAELETDPEAVQRWLTFVVVGGGPTGVEMAGQIAELAHRTLPGQFRRIDPRQARVILVDAVDAVLPTFGGKLSEKAKHQLEKIGVEVQLGTKVVGVDGTGITVETAQGRQRIESVTKIWAAGVAAPAISRRVAEAAGAEVDRAGRVMVNPDCTVPGHPEIFVVGDMMSLDRLPGVAQVAIQTGTYAGRTVAARVAGKPALAPFAYRDKGSMATISRFSAIASTGGMKFSGFTAWMMWLVVHLMYLVGFKNRVSAVGHWFVSFLGRGRSERVTTAQQVMAREAIQQVTAAGELVKAGRPE